MRVPRNTKQPDRLFVGPAECRPLASPGAGGARGGSCPGAAEELARSRASLQGGSSCSTCGEETSAVRRLRRVCSPPLSALACQTVGTDGRRPVPRIPGGRKARTSRNRGTTPSGIGTPDMCVTHGTAGGARSTSAPIRWRCGRLRLLPSCPFAPASPPACFDLPCAPSACCCAQLVFWETEVDDALRSPAQRGLQPVRVAALEWDCEAAQKQAANSGKYAWRRPR